MAAKCPSLSSLTNLACIGSLKLDKKSSSLTKILSYAPLSHHPWFNALTFVACSKSSSLYILQRHEDTCGIDEGDASSISSSQKEKSEVFIIKHEIPLVHLVTRYMDEATDAVD